MSSPQERLIEIIEAIDPAYPQVVVRWVDEPRIVPEHETGFTVGHRTYVILTARLQSGQTIREEIPSLTLGEVKRILAGYPIRALYRSDNQTR